MRRVISVIVLLAVLLGFSSCSGGGRVLLDNSGNSSFTDFYTRGDWVYIECELNIYSEKPTEVKIKAVDNEDVELGLLKNNLLVGEAADGGDTFKLKQGENKVTVYFKGEYAGVFQISQREIPRFIYIED